MEKGVKKLKKKLANTRRHCVASIIAILHREYTDSKNNAGMTGQYREGYLMGMSDAKEAVEDLALWKSYKNPLQDKIK